MGLNVKLWAFVGLVAIQTGIGSINKIALLHGGGKYTFSPASALTMAEATKFLLSFFFHVKDLEGHRGHDSDAPFSVKLKGALEVLNNDIDMSSVCSIGSLALLYLFNNQLSFFLNGGADPGSIFLFKSGSTVITALMLRFFLKRHIEVLQWAAILMQVSGLIVVQWNPCKGQPFLPMYLYCWMAISTFATATAAVRNDYVLKNLKLSMHTQNMVLYAVGVVGNASAFALLPAYWTNSRDNVGFFDGYDNVSACLVVLFNALIGIAISAVYKYADAVVKTFATATVTVNLVIFSAIYGLAQPSIVAWCGVVVVITATLIYSRSKLLGAGPAAPAAAKPLVDAEAAADAKNAAAEEMEPLAKDGTPATDAAV